MKWQAYPKYKDSGVEWLREIPEHWEARRLKTVSRFAYGDSLTADDRVPGDYDVFGSNGVVGQHDVANTQAPCLIVGRKGSFGKVVYSDRPCFAIDTTYFVDASQTNSHLRWLFYCLQWLKLDSYSKDSAVPGLAREDAYKNPIPYCRPDEQRAIAAFLDRETERLDALIARKERQIELLQEKRAALISHAVTKGLDPNAPMKDSGVEWLGEIPEHWDLKHLKWVLSSLQSGSRETGGGSQLDEGVFSLGGEHIGWMGELVLSTPRYISEDYYLGLRSGKIQKNDVLLVKDGATIGKTALIRRIPFQRSAVNEHVFIMRANQLMQSDFLFYCIWSPIGQEQIQLDIRGAAQPGLSSAFVNNVSIAVPPLPEQRTISAFLDHKTRHIDTLIEGVQNSIERLREYRTALISAAVTGKIDVRQEVA